MDLGVRGGFKGGFRISRGAPTLPTTLIPFAEVTAASGVDQSADKGRERIFGTRHDRGGE